MKNGWLFVLVAIGCAVAVGWLANIADAQSAAARVFLPHMTRSFSERTLLTNGDFEAGTFAGWEPGCECITTEGPPDGWRSGQLGARLGNRLGQRLRQTVVVPPSVGSMRFAFWYQYYTAVRDPFGLSDRFTVTIRDRTTGEVAYFHQVEARSGLTAAWQREGTDLVGWQDRPLVIEFEALSPSDATWLFLDDVELIGGSGRVAPPTPTPTPAIAGDGPEPTPALKGTPTPTPTPPALTP